jgi:hypothetical protein
MLVQDCIFEEVHVNFLIVGHTHCSIDQYFSVIARAINRSAFIASPLGMESVWGQAFTHDSKGRKNPKVTRKLDAIYDCKSAFLPFQAMKLSNHSFPFCFKFSRFHGFSRLQYKQFSTHEYWLPKSPPGPHDIENITNVPLKDGVNVSSLDFVGGKNSFLESLGVLYDQRSMKKIDILDVNSGVIEKLTALRSMYHHLQEIEAKALLKMKVQFDKADIPDPPPESMVTATMHELERKFSTEDEAVILLMKPDACRSVNPRFLNYLDEHTFLDGMPDMTAELGVDAYAEAIMEQLAPVFKTSGRATISAIIHSKPPSGAVDVLQFMRDKLSYIEQHKELIRKQKKAAKEVRSAPDGIDPRVDEDNDQEELGDLSIGVDGADMIAKTARDVFRVLFSGHLYSWSRDSGRYHAILCAA